VDGLAAQLRQAGLRNTPQRRAVLIALGHAPHSTAAELAVAVSTAARRSESAGDPSVATVDGLSRQGLYNVLEDLTHAMSYAFGRATKAVSICPPAKYADMVCERARHYLSSLFDTPTHSMALTPS